MKEKKRKNSRNEEENRKKKKEKHKNKVKMRKKIETQSSFLVSLLPSITEAHLKQNCNNFKDPGVQSRTLRSVFSFSLCSYCSLFFFLILISCTLLTQSRALLSVASFPIFSYLFFVLLIFCTRLIQSRTLLSLFLLLPFLLFILMLIFLKMGSTFSPFY